MEPLLSPVRKLRAKIKYDIMGPTKSHGEEAKRSRDPEGELERLPEIPSDWAEG